MAFVAPSLLVAVTITLSVESTSDEPAVYADAVAPVIATQLFPELSQSSH